MSLDEAELRMETLDDCLRIPGLRCGVDGPVCMGVCGGDKAWVGLLYSAALMSNMRDERRGEGLGERDR